MKGIRFRLERLVDSSYRLWRHDATLLEERQGFKEVLGITDESVLIKTGWLMSTYKTNKLDEIICRRAYRL